MTNFKRIVLATIFIGFVFSGVSFGQEVIIEISANADDIEGKLGTQFFFNETILEISVGGLYSEDNFKLGNLFFGLMDTVFSPALTLGLGFKGVAGEAEKYEEEFDLGAINFSLFGEYDLRETSVNVPIGITATVAAAPKPFCFGETKTYSEYTAGINVYIVNNAGLYIRYRKIEVRFDLDPGTVKKSHDSVFFGFNLVF